MDWRRSVFKQLVKGHNKQPLCFAVTNGHHQFVPSDIQSQAEAYAKVSELFQLDVDTLVCMYVCLSVSVGSS